MAGLEEERRLAYVGLTRAKQRARISFAANRRVHGSWQSALPSRFISVVSGLMTGARPAKSLSARASLAASRLSSLWACARVAPSRW